MAAAESRTISAKRVQPRSISKFQCDRLFGSFQSITASTTRPSSSRGIYRAIVLGRRPPAADEHLRLGTIRDGEAGAAQHRFHAAAVRHPPVRRVARVLALD